MLKRKNKKIISAMALTLAVMGATGYGLIPKMNAAINGNIPEINAYQKDGHAKIELGIDIADEDILTRCSFESNETLPGLTYQPNTGGQSITNEGLNGSSCIKLTDNITNKTGNYWGYPSTEGANSIFAFKPMSLPNGAKLSATYKAKTLGGKYSKS